MKLKPLLLIGLLGLSAFAFFGQAAPVVKADSGLDQQSILNCGTATTCSITLNPIVYGDLMMVSASGRASTSGVTATISDSAGLIFVSGSSEVSGTYGSTYIWYVTVSTISPNGISSDVVTVTWSGSMSGSTIVVYLFSGLFTDFTTAANVGTGSGTAATTASTSFSGYTWACIGSVAIETTPTAFTAGTSYTIASSGSLYGDAEYSLTVSSPTTFPMTIGTSQAWAEAGICFMRSHVSPANVWLLNANYINKPQQDFNINNYQKSYVGVQYPNSAPNDYQTTVPEVEASLAGSNLVWANVGSSYKVSLIPSSNMTFFLYSPSLETVNTLNVQDLSGTYTQGASVFIQLG